MMTGLKSTKEANVSFTNETLLKSFIELEIIFNSIPAFIFFKNREDRFLKVNKALADSLGLDLNIIVGKTTKELFPDQSDCYVRDDQEVLETGIPKIDIIEPMFAKDGMRWVHTNKMPYIDPDGNIVGIIGLSIDITDLVKSREDLRISQEQYKTLICNIPDIIYSLDDKGRFIDWNHDSLTSQLLGYTREEILEKKFIDLIDDEDQPRVKADIQSAIKNRRKYSRESQFRIKTKGEYVLWFEGHSHYTYDENGLFIREDGVLRDITGKKVIEDELTIFATTDILTDVFNRRVGIAMLEKQLNISLRSKNKLVVCFIDVNNLKMVNDSFGHKEGDRLIIAVSEVLKKNARNSDIVARMGGDEFLYVLTDCDMHGAIKAWDRILYEFKVINSSGKNHYAISASKGMIEYDPKNPKTADELIAIADTIMYHEKKIFKEQEKLKEKYYQ